MNPTDLRSSTVTKRSIGHECGTENERPSPLSASRLVVDMMRCGRYSSKRKLPGCSGRFHRVWWNIYIYILHIYIPGTWYIYMYNIYQVCPPSGCG